MADNPNPMLKFEIDKWLSLDKKDESDEDVLVHVYFGDLTARKSAQYTEALNAARDLADDTKLNALYPAVIEMTKMGMPPAHALEILRSQRERYRAASIDSAFKIAMLDEIFTMASIEGRMQVVCKLKDYELKPGWNSNQVEDEERMMMMMPPLPRRLSYHPVERKAEYIRMIFEGNTIFHLQFMQLFENAMNLLVEGSVQAIADAEVDADGFRPGDVDSVVDEPPDAGIEAGGEIIIAPSKIRTGRKIAGERP